MALVGKVNPKIGDAEETFTASFNNGTLQQLRDLADFLEKEGFPVSKQEDDEGERLLAVLKTGIGWLQKIKDDKAKTA